jgi:hypothetical protein
MNWKTVRSLRTLPIAAGIGALVVLGAGASIGAQSSDAAVFDQAQSSAESTVPEKPEPTLNVAIATPTLTATPCAKRETLPCLG